MEEKCALIANGLQLGKFKSKPEKLGEIDKHILYTKLYEEFTGPSYIVIWFDHEVLIGMWQDKKFIFFNKEFKKEHFELKYIQRLRVFNLDKELHIWRTNGLWKARFRTDYKGEESETVVVAHQLLFGTRGKRLSQDFVVIEEERGTKLSLPLKDISFDKNDTPNVRVHIKTHNYIKTNAVHQTTYCDCRFVAFTDGSNDLQ